jgi:Asp-tRNA(Asn)/Glu-tRNA(Gln) amidotransferase A subunit family amidase
MSELFAGVDVARGIDRIRAHEARVRCYVNTRLGDAEREARERASEPKKSALHGVPYGLKDEYDTACLPTTGGSWRHRNRTTAHDSTPARVFASAGAILLGKTNLSDMGLAPEASSYVGGVTRNPFDASRTAGGSSGGSAAAVAYGFHAFDWGTDIGGSIRLPAAFCGVLGLRLSNESWPIRELFPNVPPSIEWMCGQGPFTRTIDEMRAVLDVAAPELERSVFVSSFVPRGVLLYAPDEGHWPSFARDLSPVISSALGIDARVTTDLEPPRKMEEIYGGVWASHFEDLLASDRSISLGRGLLAASIAVLSGGRLGDHSFHPTTAELLLLIAAGRVTLYRDRERARRRAFAVRDSFRDLWAQGNLVIAPVTAHPPPKVYRSNRTRGLLSLTMPGNLADATGLSIPFGTFDGILPRAIQLLGPPGSERALLEMGERIIAIRDADPRLAQPKTMLEAR